MFAVLLKKSAQHSPALASFLRPRPAAVHKITEFASLIGARPEPGAGWKQYFAPGNYSG